MASEKLPLVDECINACDVLNELVENEEFLKEKEFRNGSLLLFEMRKQNCPRCKFESKTTLEYNYCPYCNWDKLFDLSDSNSVAEFAA